MVDVYARHVSRTSTPQTEPIPGEAQVPNSAGGYAYALDDWGRLDRFLILGNEGNTLYCSERKLTRENAACVIRCLDANPGRALERIAHVSESGRAPKNDPAIFALALAASHKTSPHGTYLPNNLPLYLPRVCRTGTHLFQFVQIVAGMRGWGRSLRKAVSFWYESQEAGKLAYQLTKYKQRGGWTHRDLLRLCHRPCDDPRPSVGRSEQGSQQYVYGPRSSPYEEVIHWAVRGWPSVGDLPHPDADLRLIWAAERIKRCETAKEAARMIIDYGLVREHVPTQFLASPEVWEALLQGMPMTAMVRNLATMTRVGLLTPLSDASIIVRERLGDADRLRKARVHPFSLLIALKTYASGHGLRGESAWTPSQEIVNALDRAFYLAFSAVEPTGKRMLVAVDVSGSMNAGTIAGAPGVTPRVAAAALALVTAATERNHHIVGYSGSIVPLHITPLMRLDAVANYMSGISMGATDCAQPILYAARNNIPVDAFLSLTDSETYCGTPHPSQALREYRQKTGIPAKLIVVGLTATEFSVADPNDAGSLNVAGMDAAGPAAIADFVRD